MSINIYYVSPYQEPCAFAYNAGDTQPKILIRLRNKDYTGSTIQGSLSRPDNTTVTRTLTSINSENNIFSLEWQSGDLIAAYNQQLKIVETQADGGIETHYTLVINVV